MQRTKLHNIALILLLVLLVTSPAPAMNTATRTRHRHRARFHRVRLFWNPLLRGSHESLVRQNEEIDRLQLPRIADDEELAELEARKELVPLNDSAYLNVASDLEPRHRYCRPWARDFVEDLGQAYYEEFHKPIEITSAVRTIRQQRRLRRHNRNAAPEKGEIASSHLAGVTVDILKRGMTRREHRWIEQYFYELKEQDLIEPAEERRQPVFHVMVSDRYLGWHEDDVQQLVQSSAIQSVDSSDKN